MSEPNPRHENLAEVISDMEGAIGDVDAWAEALLAVGTATHLLQPAAIYAIGCALKEVSDALREQYYRAHALTRPQAEQAGGTPCT